MGFGNRFGYGHPGYTTGAPIAPAGYGINFSFGLIIVLLVLLLIIWAAWF
ncbi:hypothetical protein [Paenisporosarcina sp. TG20]|nr:hypothetical protein [Paenisporosarcina sp. TG20]